MSGVNNAGNEDLMSELDAVKALTNLGVTWQGLRKYAGDQQALRKMGSSVLYIRAFVEDLSANWVTKQQVMRSLGFGSTRFFYWVKSRGIKPIMVGYEGCFYTLDVTGSSPVSPTNYNKGGMFGMPPIVFL
jgi:hypothetical protein